MLRISSNVASLAAQRAFHRTERETSQAMKELASGSKFANPGSDPAGQSIAEGLHSQIRGYQAAQTNAENATSFVAIAEAALAEQNNIAIRLRELAVQAASDTLSDTEREFLNDEVTQLTEEFDRIAKTTKFGSQSLLDGSSKTYEFQVGLHKGSDNVITYTNDTDTTASNLNIDGIDVSDKGDARDALGDLDEAMTGLSAARAKLGAVQSRLDTTVSHISSQVENLSGAYSTMADTDIADAVSRMRRGQILAQYQTAALQSANDSTGLALRLIA